MQLMYATDDFVSFFFFSSRRRHTRLQGDWSSDVCSSDLVSLRIACSRALGSEIAMSDVARPRLFSATEVLLVPVAGWPVVGSVVPALVVVTPLRGVQVNGTVSPVEAMAAVSWRNRDVGRGEAEVIQRYRGAAGTSRTS